MSENIAANIVSNHLNTGSSESESQNIESALTEQSINEASQEINAESNPQESNTQDEFSSKFAALSRKEKEFRVEKEQWESQRSEYEAMKAELEQLKAASNNNNDTNNEQVKEELPLEYRLRRNPLETLKELGLDYSTLTDLAINDGKMSPEMQMKLMQEDLDSKYEKKFGSQIEELKAEIAAKEKAESEARVQNAVEEFNNKINDHITSNAEEYELISANKANNLVYDVIEQHYNDSGRMLDVKEAADAVESYLLDEAQKLMKLNKLSGLRKEAEPVNKPDLFRQSPTTLSNVQSAQTPKLAERKLSNEESKAKAAQLIKWS